MVIFDRRRPLFLDMVCTFTSPFTNPFLDDAALTEHLSMSQFVQMSRLLSPSRTPFFQQGVSQLLHSIVFPSSLLFNFMFDILRVTVRQSYKRTEFKRQNSLNSLCPLMHCDVWEHDRHDHVNILMRSNHTRGSSYPKQSSIVKLFAIELIPHNGLCQSFTSRTLEKSLEECYCEVRYVRYSPNTARPSNNYVIVYSRHGLFIVRLTAMKGQ